MWQKNCWTNNILEQINQDCLSLGPNINAGVDIHFVEIKETADQSKISG